MTRAHIHYDGSRNTRGKVYVGLDVSTPTAGFYRHRLRAGAVRGGVRIWFGPPHDPVTGEVLDRSYRWQAEFDGEPVDIDDVWPVCGKHPITETEYHERVYRKRWAQQNAPDSAFADRTARYDPLSSLTPLPF